MPRKLLRNAGRHFVSTIGSMFCEVLVSWLPGHQWQDVSWFPPGCRTQKWHGGHSVHRAADSLTCVYSCSASKHVGIFAALGVKVKTFHYLHVSHNLPVTSNPDLRRKWLFISRERPVTNAPVQTNVLPTQVLPAHIRGDALYVQNTNEPCQLYAAITTSPHRR